MDAADPVTHLIAATKLYPNLARFVDEFRSRRGRDLPAWPDWCFLPMSGWYAIVCEENKVPVLGPELAADVGRLAAIGTWRYSQGIYRLDRKLFAALADSKVSGPLPSEVFFRLPEWCVYVETRGLSYLGENMHGFWAHLEWDANTERTELRFLVHSEVGLNPVPVHIGPWTVSEALERVFDEAAVQAEAANLTFDKMSPKAVRDQAAGVFSEQLKPLISVLLYLCSDMPELDNHRQPRVSPSRPKAKKTKEDIRFFPASGPTFWDVGSSAAAKLRDLGEVEPTGRRVRPHLRRGHWHGYWTGKMSESNRKFVYKWLTPMLVAAAEEEDEEPGIP